MVTTDKLESLTLDAKTTINQTKEDKEALDMVQKRYDAMKKSRGDVEKIWDYVDANFKAPPRSTWNWLAVPTLKMEEALIEASVGMQDLTLPISVEADGRADWIQMQLAKYTLDHFIYKEKIAQEIRLHMDYTRARYGTAVLFSWMEYRSKFIAKEDESGYFNPKGEVEHIEELHIKMKDIPVRNAYFDDTAYRYEDAVDCIYEERLSIDEYKLRYLNVKWESKEYFTNAEYVGTKQPDDTFYKKDKVVDNDMVKIWHYYNKLYAKYVIVANEEIVIYNGLASTRHGELPLVPVQFYNNPYSIRGIGIPERYAVIKGINTNFYQAMIGWAWLNAGTALILWEWQDVDWGIFLEPGEVNLIQMTKGSARDVTPFQTGVNVQQLVEIIQFMDDMGSYLTWINIKAPYTSPAKTAFETSVMKEEQNNRLKTIYDTRVLGLEQAFTLMLSNIFTFLPYQYAEKMVDEQEKIIDYKYYQIPVQDKRISTDEKWNILSIDNEKGYKGYFDLKPKLLEWARGLKVKIVTPPTASTMKALEIENLTKFLQAKQMIVQFKQFAMQSGGDVGMREKLDERLNVLFNIDKDNIDIESSEQKIRDKMAEITQLISSFTLWWNPDETVNQTGMEQAPTLPQTSTSWEETTPTVQAPSDPLQSYVQSGGQTNTQ